MNNYESERLAVTNAFMVTLQISGYTEGFRRQTALAAFRGVARKQEEEAGGGRRVYRLQTEGAVARHRAKISAKSSWFKKKVREEGSEWVDGTQGGPRQPRVNSTARKTEDGADKDERQAEGVIFVPYTTGGKLRSRLQNEDDKITRMMRMPRLRYIERPGRSVADSLVEKDPWYRLQGGYTRDTCPVCFWQKGKGIACTRENVN
jgi:hypothetical protein